MSQTPRWSTPQFVLFAMGVAFLSCLPAFGVFYYRFYQLWNAAHRAATQDAQVALAAARLIEGVANLGLRDITTFAGIWIVFAVAWVRYASHIVRVPGKRLRRYLLRLAQGHYETAPPALRSADLQQLVESIASLVHNYNDNRRLSVEKIIDLRAQNERIVNTATSPLCVLAPSGAVVYGNAAAAREFGLEHAALPGSYPFSHKRYANAGDLLRQIFEGRTDDVGPLLAALGLRDAQHQLCMYGPPHQWRLAIGWTAT